MRFARVTERLLRRAFGSALTLAAALFLAPPGSGGAAPVDPGTARSPDEIFWQQPDRILHAARTITPGAPGRADVFFVGFAGDDSQEVFSREVRYAAAVIGRRVDGSPRSLLLLNNRAANEAGSPIASIGTLRLALEAVAARMDLQQDVLFLYLTSHGLPTRELYVSNGNLPLEQISATRLRELLDGFGFRRKVVVVSACFSGEFARALADDSTAVLTAARADRPSFGCRDSRDLTYFGEALWEYAMQRAWTFSEAFDLARARVEDMEQEAGLVPSEPQVFVGRDAARWLTRIALRPDEAGERRVAAR